MPTYDYACPSCGDFSALRRISQRDEAIDCPDCGGPSTRQFINAPLMSTMEGSTREAHTRNERAAHEPKHTATGHGAGCSCCSSSTRKSKTRTGADGSKAFPSSRPWMISH